MASAIQIHNFPKRVVGLSSSVIGADHAVQWLKIRRIAGGEQSLPVLLNRLQAGLTLVAWICVALSYGHRRRHPNTT